MSFLHSTHPPHDKCAIIVIINASIGFNAVFCSKSVVGVGVGVVDGAGSVVEYI